MRNLSEMWLNSKPFKLLGNRVSEIDLVTDTFLQSSDGEFYSSIYVSGTSIYHLISHQMATMAEHSKCIEKLNKTKNFVVKTVTANQ